jgi:prenyltransferase beta subunit
MQETISIKLFKTLVRGKNKLEKESLSGIKHFVESQRTPDDSFMDKSGKSDLYYTVFGWMLSYVLDIRLDKKKMAIYLERHDAATLDLIHYAAYMRCRMIYNLFAGYKLKLLVDSLSTKNIRKLPDFDTLPHNDPDAPYTRFIWLSLLEDTRNAEEDRERVLKSLNRYRTTNGGYSNIKDSANATANATAAALSVTGQLQGYSSKANKDTDYLVGIQDETGGFAATENAPVPDILSTATVLFVLSCYGIKPRISPVDFIEAHWLEDKGFLFTLLEDSSDVEYTFYGLLALGTL